ncbi:MAG TPA: hypothetical protein EYG27_11645 [Dehalococcoidia bacterium]|jgi:hypothetical protein|nr:hypothetical protein [Dehalococcoidia bacterium]HIL32169.1 hypothetical protein [Dehalococcoidia bacterium]
MATDPTHEHEHIPEELYGVLPDDGVIELTDQLTGYMHEVELGGFTDIIGQVLDDFLEQSGGMPSNLKADDAFEQITQNQLAVTLAYNLGRLEGRSPQIVEKMVDEAIEKFGILELEESNEITDSDLESPKLMVYSRLRRIEYTEAPSPNVQLGWENPPEGAGPDAPSE